MNSTYVDHEGTINVLLVTSPNEQCGIREYGAMLTESVMRHKISIVEEPPDSNTMIIPTGTHIVHVNHHAALHSSWQHEHIDLLHEDGFKVVVTQHDTYETFAIMRDRGFTDFTNADALIVHEPITGLTGRPNVHFFRQGVPAPQPPIAHPHHPVIGTFGFPFPWKRFELLNKAADEAGWTTMVLDSTAQWMPRKKVIQMLSGCDATAFLHNTAGSGTSAAIRMGIAARKPLIATPCRQMRDLNMDDLGWSAVWWATEKDEIVVALEHFEDDPELFADEINALADRDSWTNLGEKYAGIYKMVLEGER
jgi:hypothetical protein